MSVGEILEGENDRPAYVRFERRAFEDTEATLEAGHYVSKDVDIVMVTPPYSKDLYENHADTWFAQVEDKVRKGRVPINHLEFWKKSYERWKDGQEMPLEGTSVKDWNALSPAQCVNLISAGCKTVEDLASANEDALRRIGMGAVALKNKARTWLQAAKDHGPLVNEVTELKRENEQLKGSLESLQEQMTLLTRQMDKKPQEPQEAIVTREKISAEDILPTLAEQYEDKFGKKPHHRMKKETIRRKLEE